MPGAFRSEHDIASMRVVAEREQVFDELARAAAEIEHARFPRAREARELADRPIEEPRRRRKVFRMLHPTARRRPMQVTKVTQGDRASKRAGPRAGIRRAPR